MIVVGRIGPEGPGLAVIRVFAGAEIVGEVRRASAGEGYAALLRGEIVREVPGCGWEPFEGLVETAPDTPADDGEYGCLRCARCAVVHAYADAEGPEAAEGLRLWWRERVDGDAWVEEPAA